MPNIKIIYIALAIVLTQTVRLEDSHKPYNLDQSDFKLFVGQKKANLPLATKPNQNAMERTDILVVAYFKHSSLTLEGLGYRAQLGLAKDSLKVLFLKGGKDFSPDRLQENCENGEVVGVFETSESWYADKVIRNTIIFQGTKGYIWTKPLVFNIPKPSSFFSSFQNSVWSPPSDETKIPNLKNIGLSLSRFEANDSEESLVLKYVKGGMFTLEFTLSVKKSKVDEFIKLNLRASKDAELLNMLEKKYQESKMEERVKSKGSSTSEKSEEKNGSSGDQGKDEPLVLNNLISKRMATPKKGSGMPGIKN